MPDNTNPFKELRKSSGMTQKQFSEFFGIPRRTIEDWERGHNKCAPYLIDLMAFRLAHKRLK